MSTYKNAPATTVGDEGELIQSCPTDTTQAPPRQVTDVFAEARARYTIPELWGMLRLPGDPPTPGRKFSSPFRPDRNPSCDISKDGKWFADRSEGLNLDAVAFAKHALDCDWPEVRLWFLERLGIDHRGGKAAPRPAAPPPQEIAFPGEVVTGDEQTWKAFAERRGMLFRSVHVAVGCGILRFVKVAGVRCYVITDASRHAAEIRRIDGGEFLKGEKVYRLRGINKEWLVGGDLLRNKWARDKPVLVCEGATDLLSAWDAYTRHRRDGGAESWIPLGLLGASCRKLHPELIPWMRGRTVRLAPDGDSAGKAMGEHWRDLLLDLGCRVEIVNMPEGRDLRDLLESGELQPGELFA